MNIDEVQLGPVIYNPSAQAFESLAVVPTPTGQRSIPCAVQATLSMRPADAAQRLKWQALRHSHDRASLCSQRVARPTEQMPGAEFPRHIAA